MALPSSVLHKRPPPQRSMWPPLVPVIDTLSSTSSHPGDGRSRSDPRRDSGLRVHESDRRCVLAVPLVLLLTYYACLWLHPPTQQLVSWHTQRWVYNALRRVRLLALPITRRYNLAAYHDQECLVYNPLYSDPTPNCSFCAAVKSVILLDEFSNFTQYYYGQADPVLVKGGQKDHVGLEDVQHLHAVHGKTLDLRPDEVSCSNDSVSSFSHLFRLFPTEETLARSSTTFQWKTQRVAGTRLLRELFPRPYFISPDSEVSLLKLLVLQGSQATPHALVFQLQFYNAWLAIGSGSLSLHLTPVPACHAPCRTLSVHAKAGDLDVAVWAITPWSAVLVVRRRPDHRPRLLQPTVRLHVPPYRRVGTRRAPGHVRHLIHLMPPRRVHRIGTVR
ncbi:uncharacterized protein LOC144728292 isoform X5 [Lampetra planeri]